MAIDRAAIERIDSTLLPQLDRHHLRLLSHCLDSFQSMAAPGSTGAIPEENQRRRWFSSGIAPVLPGAAMDWKLSRQWLSSRR